MVELTVKFKDGHVEYVSADTNDVLGAMADLHEQYKGHELAAVAGKVIRTKDLRQGRVQ